MKNMKDTKTVVTAALLAAFTCIATMVIQIPTPTFGYIHPGDSLVLLSGVILGPVLGGMSAGIGSMLADLLSGYAIYAIPTFIIKALSAALAGLVFRKIRAAAPGKAYLAFTAAAIPAECNVVFGYFINSIVKTMFLAGSYNGETLAAGLAGAVSGVLPNAVQATVGILIGLALFPILSQVPDIRIWLNLKSKKSA